jgi:DNA-binding NtrC family response regulator
MLEQELIDMGPRKQKVYVVDDEKVIAETLAMILNGAGFIALPFVNPREALDAAAFASPPDLLISDVVMPEMSGVDLAIQFRKTYPECRILLFSGRATTASLLEAARSQGFDFDILKKPLHPDDLLAKIRSFSDRWDSGQADVSGSSKEPVTGRNK